MWINSATYAYTGGKPFDASKPCIVFLHGAQNDHSVWSLQSRYLAHHGYAVLAFDLPGHGRSKGKPLPSVEAIATWLLATLDALKLGPVVLVGHSMGSLIALEAASQAPEMVFGLALLGSAFPMKVSAALLEACASNEADAFDLINRFTHSSLSHLPGSPGPGFSVYWQGRRLMERQLTGVLWTDFNACNAYVRGELAANDIVVPTLILSAENDAMTPPSAVQGLRNLLAQRLGERLTYQLLERCGHALMAEQPDQVLSALHGFISTLTPPTRQQE
jgi:pimeloyl-ACP methyl ester carboxylesterase